MNIGTSAPVQQYPSNIIKFGEQNIYCSLDVITKFCQGKTRNASKAKAFSIMFYVVSLGHEIRRKGRCWYVPKISYSLIAWIVLPLSFGSKFYPSVHALFSTKTNFCESLGQPTLGKVRYRRPWFLYCTKSRLKILLSQMLQIF